MKQVKVQDRVVVLCVMRDLCSCVLCALPRYVASLSYVCTISDVSYVGINTKCVDVKLLVFLYLIPVKLNKDFQFIRIVMNLDQQR